MLAPGRIAGRTHGFVAMRDREAVTPGRAGHASTALLAGVDALRPRADAMNKRLIAEREARYAGRRELDEDGRRDRRGFDEAKKLLHEVGAYQLGPHSGTGRYATTRSEVKRIREHPIVVRPGLAPRRPRWPPPPATMTSSSPAHTAIR